LALTCTTWAVADAPGLPKDVSDALRLEADDALPLTAFYDTPKSLDASKPGDLLRSEPGTGYQLPTGAHAIRILYHSRDSRDHDVATPPSSCCPPARHPGMAGRSSPGRTAPAASHDSAHCLSPRMSPMAKRG
jgi:hypothetical protein